MSKPKILIYGTTGLSSELRKLVEDLTREILKNPSVVLISGGFEVFEDEPDRISVDVCVRDTAKEVLTEAEFDQRFETWLPSEDKERDDVRRFRAGKVREMSDWSHQTRRFNLVLGSDAIVTVSGEGNTRTVLDLAYAVNKPALPLGFTGDDSAWFWKRYKQEVAERLRLDKDLAVRLSNDASIPNGDERRRLAAKVASILINAGQQWRCLVLMPYGEPHDRFYDEEIAPAIRDAGFHPHRIDRDDQSGRIFDLFAGHLEDSRAVIVDATDLNHNVMYELGFAHALRIEPLIISRDPPKDIAVKKLPFYLGETKVVAVDAPGEDLQRRVESFLRNLSAPSR